MRFGRFLWFHTVNRNEKPKKCGESERRREYGSILRHGEAWLEIWKLKFHWTWLFFDKSKFFGWKLKTCGEESDLSFFTACPPVALWFSVGGLIRRPRMDDDARYAKRRDGKMDWQVFHEWYSRQPGERETGFSIHDWTIWFEFWQKTMESSSSDPWYRRFAFAPIDFLLGRHKYSEKPLYEEDVEIPMPEKTYKGHVKIYEASWKRPLWPFTKRMVRSSIDVPEGLPHAGKGENSWDCGDDAIYAQHSAAATPKAAVEAIIASAMRNRKRYGNASFLKSKV
jgi:hypothetical protein